MAISISSFPLQAASLGGAVGLLVVCSGLYAAGADDGPGTTPSPQPGLRAQPREAVDGRLLRLMSTARRDAGMALPTGPAAAALAPPALGPPEPPPHSSATPPPLDEVAADLVQGPATGSAAPSADHDRGAGAAPVARATPAPGADVLDPTGLTPGPGARPRDGRYRDPVLPPLVGQPQWREWVLAVEINGREVSQGGLFAQEPATGRLAIALDLLRLWRIRFDPAAAITLQGEPFYPLDAIDGARAVPDYDLLTVKLTLPAQAFEVYSVDALPERGPPPTAGSGAFLDYDLLFTAGQGVQEDLAGLAEAGMFGSWGVLTTSLRAQDMAQDPHLDRLETTFSRDFVERRATLRLGDTMTVSGGLGSSARMGGIQYATNFATDPSFVTFPTPAIGGLAEQSSVVDVFIDNLRRDQRQVPAGPFQLDNLPIVTGAGQVELRVTDLLGRERLVVQPYYVSPRLLKEGLHDFAYELGLERRHYGERSFDYGDLLASTTQRYGFSGTVTGEAHAEATADTQNLAVGGATLLPRNLGVLSGGLGLGQDDGEVGGLGQLAYEYQNSRFGFGARTRLTSDGFRQLGQDNGDTRRVDQLNLSFGMSQAGSAGLLFLNEVRDGGDDYRLLSGSWSVPAGPGNFLLSLGQSLEPDHDLSVVASYALPLGGNRSITGQAGRQNGRSNASTTFRQTRGASDLGLDYRLSAQGGDKPNFVESRFDYQTGHGAGTAELEHFDGDNRLRLGIDGSLAIVDGRIEASRRLGNAFGLVEVPGFENIRVYLDNREVGRTDGDGRLLLPGLRPYEANRVRIELDDIPIEAVLGSPEITAVPYDRSGVMIRFAVERTPQAIATLLDGAGSALPGAMELVSADGKVRAIVGRDGFAQVTGPLEDGVEVTGGVGRRRFACLLPPGIPGEVLPDLGEVRCH